MPINPFFNHYRNKQEQNLIEDLINEAVKMMGFDAFYIIRDNKIADDLIYGDSPLKKFEKCYPIEVYFSNSIDPGINQDFFSKFGLEIKNNIRIQMPRRAFSQRVRHDQSRPLEGDLIYIPWLSGTGELYEIKFVNDTKDFFTLGRKYPYYWELELELFKYSNEEIITGIEEIDTVNEVNAFSVLFEMDLDSGSGNYEQKEIAFQGLDSANATCYGTVQEWDEVKGILRLSNIAGIFNPNTAITGIVSGASYNTVIFNSLDSPQTRDGWDNMNIQIESENIIDTTEENPFGGL